MKKITIFLILFLMILPLNASAIRLTMGSDTKVFFQPNGVHELKFTVSDAEKQANVIIAIKGDMAKYAKADQQSIRMAPGDRQDITVKLQLPAELSEGIHTFEVSATETPVNAQPGAFILMPGTGVNIRIINTNKDYDCGVGMFNAMISGNTVKVLLNTVNNGKQSLTANAEFKVYANEDIFLTSWKTGDIGVPSFDSSTVESSTTIPGEALPGKYYLKGTLTCPDKTLPLNMEMTNAATELKINGFKVYKENGFLNLEFDLENAQDAPVSAYAVAILYKGDKEIDRYGMPQVTVPPKGKTIMSLRPPLNELGIEPADYTFKGRINYLGKTEDYIATITLTEEDLGPVGTGGGFKVNQPAQPEPQQQQIVLEQPAAEGTSNKTLVRIIAGLLILVILTLIILKVLSKKNQ